MQKLNTDNLWADKRSSTMIAGLFVVLLVSIVLLLVNFVYLNRWVKNATARKTIIWLLRIMVIISALVGTFNTPGTTWAIGDIGVGATAWLNIVAILFLQIPAHKALWDYRRQKKAGLDPQFDPVALGIKNADFWEERTREMKVKKAGEAPAPASVLETESVQ